MSTQIGPVDNLSPTPALEAIIGGRVRELRIDLGLTTAQLGELAGISKAMVSKIENGRTSPSLRTLERLARALEVPLTSLFRGLDEEHDIVIIRSGRGHEILHEGSGPGRIYQDLGTLRGPNRVIEPMLTTLTGKQEVFPLYQHPGVEFIHMLEGSMQYGYGAGNHRIDAGDTMQFHGEVAHGPTELLVVPVTFLSVKVYPPPAGEVGNT